MSEEHGLRSMLAPGQTAAQTRAAIAAYVLEHKDRVRSIARNKLTRNTRRVFDSDEVLSSVLRRLDGMAVRGTLMPHSEAELWGLIEAIAQNTAVSKTRLIERARNMVTDDGPYAYELLKRLNACETDDEATLLVNRMLMSLPHGPDRQITVMFLRGATHRAIGDILGISEEASRQRWHRIRSELARRFQEGSIDG